MNIKYTLLLSIALLFSNYTESFSQTNANTTESPEVKKAFDVLDKVIKNNKFVVKLDSIGLLSLPIGIGSKDKQKAEKYAIIISEAKVEKEKFLLTVYMAFTIPGTTQKVAFKGENISFNSEGGLTGEKELHLVSDVKFDLAKNIGIVIKGDGETKAQWDCEGFKSMDISADLLLDSTIFISEKDDGSLNVTEPLKTSFRTSISDWNDFFVNVNLSPFQIKGITGVGFKITNAVLDLSDTKNPIGIVFNENYNNHFIGGNTNLWQGLYIQEAEIRLPKQFKKTNNTNTTHTERLKFRANNLWIDELGFTGKLSSENLMTIDEGNLSGWKFSVDNFLIDIQNNRLKAGKFDGYINIPAFNQNSLFKYDAQLGLNDTYSFNVAITDSIDFNMWAAKMKIHPNSQLSIKVVEHKFLPRLLLNGEMNLEVPVSKANTNSKRLSLGEIEVQGMKLQTVEPYINIDHISYGKKQNIFANFPISINKIDVKSKKNELGLELGVNVNFTKNKDGGFGGKGTFTIWGKKDNDRWKYHKLDISQIAVKISKGEAFQLKGGVNFINGDEIYGDGFKGELNANFAGFEMKASALFGNVNDYRYWFADALLAKDDGVSVGPLSIYGFGGGAYYHVKQSGMNGASVGEIGQSSSGICYKPDKNIGLGLKSTVKFGSSIKKEMLNGDALFKISFNTHGGINRMVFDGNAYFATSSFDINRGKLIDNVKYVMNKTSGAIHIPKDSDKSQLSGDIRMTYDFPAKSFHSTFNIYANIAGGAIKGIGKNGKAGYGIIHFAPDDWYVYLGKPSNPNGINVLNIAKMDNYFMAGKTIAELPDIPQKIKNNIRNYKPASSDNLGTGKGFAFGTSFFFDTGERKFLIFYGRFGCGIGCDVLMKNYGHTTCEGSNRLIGINGWYAQGQAYAWIKAEVGVEVNLIFRSGRFSIFDLELATLLQMKAPNPFWMKGNVGGHYNILGGLVKGRCDFDFEIGKQCKMQSSNPLGGIQIISDITPSDKETNIDVFNTPQVVFNMPVNKKIKIKNEKKQDEIYRIKLQQFKITDEKGNELIGKINWNKRKDVAVFKPKDIMPGKTNIKVDVKVSFQKLTNGNWSTVTKNGKVAQEVKKVTFKTGVEPDYIPKNNVQYSYPKDKSFNYYKMEANNNYIKLKVGQPGLFNLGKEWVQKIRVTPIAGGKSLVFDYQYNKAQNQINFHIPNEIANNKVYRLELLNVPTVDAASIDKNVNKKEDTRKIGKNNNTSDVKITTNEAEGSRSELKEKVIYSLNFRTSEYNTFTDKINGLYYSDYVLWELAPLVHSLTSNIQGERFDRYEIMNSNTKKMISCEPVLSETSWYVNHIKPIFNLSNAELNAIGAEKFIVNEITTYLFQENGTRLLSQDEINTGIANAKVRSGMKHYIAKYTQSYLSYLKGHLANSSVNRNNMPQGLLRVFNANFTSLKRGYYPVKIKYTLPGKKEPHRIVKRNIKF